MTDLANLANLLSPPEKAGNKKNRTKFLVEYTVFENPSKVSFYTTLRTKTLFGKFFQQCGRESKCFSRSMQLCFVTFAVFLDGLFEGSDVSKRAQEKNDDISLIFYRRNLQKKPQGSA